MRTLLHFKPGQQGTKQLLAVWCPTRVCALLLRCPAEEALQDRGVDCRGTCVGTAPTAFCCGRDGGVRVGFAEVELRDQVKQADGKWNRSRKVWEMRYDHVVVLKLEARIVEEASHTRYQS